MKLPENMSKIVGKTYNGQKDEEGHSHGHGIQKGQKNMQESHFVHGVLHRAVQVHSQLYRHMIYDFKKKADRVFKIARIREEVIVDDMWSHEKKHQKSMTAASL